MRGAVSAAELCRAVQSSGEGVIETRAPGPLKVVGRGEGARRRGRGRQEVGRVKQERACDVRQEANTRNTQTTRICEGSGAKECRGGGGLIAATHVRNRKHNAESSRLS